MADLVVMTVPRGGDKGAVGLASVGDTTTLADAIGANGVMVVISSEIEGKFELHRQFEQIMRRLQEADWPPV